eukprot:761405-Hanusia_phi.AAC.6
MPWLWQQRCRSQSNESAYVISMKRHLRLHFVLSGPDFLASLPVRLPVLHGWQVYGDRHWISHNLPLLVDLCHGIVFVRVALFSLTTWQAWGVTMWRSIDPQCSAEYEKPEYQNLFFIFQVQVVLSVLNGFGSLLELLGLPFRSAGFADTYTQIDEKAPQNPETEGFV